MRPWKGLDETISTAAIIAVCRPLGFEKLGSEDRPQGLCYFIIRVIR